MTKTITLSILTVLFMILGLIFICTSAILMEKYVGFVALLVSGIFFISFGLATTIGLIASAFIDK